jgi:hypothetical protein
MTKIINWVCGLLIGFGVYLFTYHLFQGDMLFHTDIARDFLLIQDLVTTHDLTLIGPRAGAIPGVFFGPIWLYLNAPAFIIGNGNPIIVGYFWVLLMIIGLIFTFLIAKKVFSLSVGVFAATLFVYSITLLAPGFTQSFLPVVISPIAFFFVYLFVEFKKKRYLTWAAILNGLLLQCQPAFGAIFFLITFIISIIIFKKKKHLRYLFVWFAVLIPLVTYVLFELRHSFLEIRSAITYFTHPHAVMVQGDSSFQGHILARATGFLSNLNIRNIDSVFVTGIFVILFGLTCFLWYKSKPSHARTFTLLIGIYYTAFWFFTLFFKGTIWDYYHWGFYPLLSIFFASLSLKIDKRIFLGIFSIILVLMVYNDTKMVQIWKENFSNKDTSSWLLNEKIADYIYQHAEGDFGYFVYSPDEFGYAKKYAMSYIGNSGQYASKGTLCIKEKITYLIYNSIGNNVYTDPVFWKTYKVNINVKPVSTTVIDTITVEKYILDQKQINAPSDPNIICNLQFR